MKIKNIFLFAFLVYIITMLLLVFATQASARTELLSPCPQTGCFVYIAPKDVNKPTNKVLKRLGLVSYYSRKGCLGCSKDFTMANGQKLDDAKLTIAYNIGKLNRKVKITSSKGKSVIATVTDRGGFERHGKIADLSFGTKNALQCADVCKVEIEEL